ncbi:SDR family oxidoreductase [Herbiconiux sp. CPCC 203407]|uniref:SDR family oxidoreductase n=1 Tax=Herbiconiux oxytropis TaxID=2970915 RepID=A0AA41XFQ6_9MICO|nr:SDR family NAD(P)-dependent oxidoreductase [Herbiconiux oxytropis]MCS5721836.1 SDR family oxidoreductase [Herbiconiux oxytropis]MCS5727362.1 SDR family oxidoreductase [Herbiconiux oxytropis]
MKEGTGTARKALWVDLASNKSTEGANRKELMSYTHPKSLEGKAVVVTGSARGIGRGIARTLARNGARLLVTDILADDLETLREDMTSHGTDVHSIAADLREPDAAERIIEEAYRKFGAVHGLVNNAMAIKPPSPLECQTLADFDLAISTGPRATFALMKAAYPHLVSAGGGSIVNFGSGAGAAGEPGFASYGAAKESIRGLSRVAALEWGADNIRVNVVLPFARTEGTDYWEQTDPEAFNAAVNAVPLKRIGDSEKDVGALVSFLLSDDSTYLTAQSIFVAGGSGVSR